MAGSTRYFGMGYFDFGDPLGTDFAGQVEIDRWVFMDKQLYGLMSIFGNGVIQGWEVKTEEALSVSISEGYGNINFIAGRTEFPFTLTDIPPNSVNYVYAKVKERTRFAEDVEFFLSTSSDLTDPHFLLIAEIIAGPLSIERIDNTVRQEITFLEIIKSAIRNHKHRGGSLNPSKINLATEVKGQLPAFRIADFDAEKITTGTFDLARMPLLDHSDLENVGLLTHPQLDTFVKTIESTNKEIFGEIHTANLLQLIIAMKLIYDDPDSSFYISERTVDQYMINEFAVIPGVTTDNFIDFDNSTANIDKEQHFIAGILPTTGTSFYVNYDTNLAWNSSYSLENVIVVDDSVTLSFNESDETTLLSIENFESATSPNQILSGTNDGGQELFKKETVITSDNAQITANTVETDVLEGFYSGRFSHQQSIRVQYKKEFTADQDWSSYDSFVLDVKCLSSIHGAVKLFFYKSDGTISQHFTLLDQDEVTDNNDDAQNGFEKRVIDLDLLSFRSTVKGFVIYSDDTLNPFSFLVDHINIQRATLLPEVGTLIVRYSTANQVVFSNVTWDTIEPSGTDIKVRARSASGSVFLTREDYTSYLSNGETINLRGTDLEIEVTFTPDSDRVLAPILELLRILILTEAEIDGFKIDSATEFERGESSNIEIHATDETLELDTPVYVDSYVFCLGNSVSQIYETSDNGENFVQGEIGLFGQDAPIAPNQVFAAIEFRENRATISRLFEPRSVIRQDERTFIVADTFNDRILEIQESGELVSGIGSINYEHGDKVFPISSCVDTRTGILYIVWSKKISFNTVNVNKIVLQTVSKTVQLIENFDKILGLTVDELANANAEGQVMPIHLSLQNSALAAALKGEDSFLSVSSDVLTGGISADSVFYQAIVTGLGIPLYVGKFAYIDGISCPTYANKTDADGFVVANATLGVVDFVFPESVEGETLTKNTNVTPVIEIDKNNNVVYGTDKMRFSPFVPGRVEKLTSDTILIGGIKPTGEIGTSEDFNFRNITGDAAEKSRRLDVLNTLFFGNQESALGGAAIILNTKTGATTFEYISPEGLLVSDVDVDPNDGSYVIAESSFKKSGRIIKVDSSGNITFSFGEGLYSVINDVFVQVDGSLVIST